MPIVTWSVDPIALRLGALELRYYSLLFELALLAGYGLLLHQIRRGGGDVEEAGDFLCCGTVGALAGARLGHVLFYDLQKAVDDPVWIFKVWTGGLASHGAVVGLALAMLLFMRRRDMPFLEGADRLCFSAALGSVFIRCGNLANSEILGKATDGSWGIRFPRADGELAPPRHPSQLYEMLLGVAVLVLLWYFDRRWGRERRPRGALLGLALVGYFSGRFAVEFFKDYPPTQVVGSLNLGQLLSLPLALVGAWLLRWSLRQRLPAGWRLPPRRSAERRTVDAPA